MYLKEPTIWNKIFIGKINIDSEESNLKNRVIKYFNDDRFAEYTGITIDEVEKNMAECSLEIKDHHLNAKDYVQGGVIFTLADYTFAVAANADSIDADSVGGTVSMSAEIDYIKPGDGKSLSARAEFISSEGRISHYGVDILNDRNEVIAKAKIKGFTKNN